MRSPLHSEAELRAYDRQQSLQLVSFELTARLTYFVVSAEMVVCGYILLNADKFGHIGLTRWLYLLGGLAALSGMLWRAVYNEGFHLSVHGSRPNKFISVTRSLFYFFYVGASILFFALMIFVGFNQLTTLSGALRPQMMGIHSEEIGEKNVELRPSAGTAVKQPTHTAPE